MAMSESLVLKNVKFRIKAIEQMPKEVRPAKCEYTNQERWDCARGELLWVQRMLENQPASDASLLTEARLALEEMMEAHRQIMPGIKYIACQNYAVVNDAPVRAEKVLARLREREG